MLDGDLLIAISSRTTKTIEFCSFICIRLTWDNLIRFLCFGKKKIIDENCILLNISYVSDSFVFADTLVNYLVRKKTV